MLMDPKFVKQIKPFLGVIFLQFGYAGFAIIAKSALNQGMSHYTLSVYRNIVATIVVAPFALVLERKIRPRMTLCSVQDNGTRLIGNLYYARMKYTTATFTAAMCNILPATTFLLAWAVRLERVNVKRLQSQAKIMGTILTVGGAMIMTLVTGSILALPWIKLNPNSQHDDNAQQDPIKGALMITAGCVCWSIFYILQAITLKSYPAGLSLTGLICMVGGLQGTVLTLVMARGNAAVWSIGWDAKLLAYAYGGVICSGVAYYASGVIMQEKGPVFVTSFNPLNMVIVAVLSSFILGEQLDVGKIAGAVVIVLGLYLVIWGKTKDQKESCYTESDQIDQQQKSATSKASQNDYFDATKTTSGDDVV